MRKLHVIPVIALFLIVSLFQGKGVAVAKAPFPDMPSFGQEEISRLHKEKILHGNPDGSLKPHDRITRAEAITLIGRALKLDGTRQATNFSDVPADHYASGYIATGVKNGLVKGRSATKFAPNALVTRMEAAVFLSRAFDFTGSSASNRFSDVHSGLFGAAEIDAVTAARIVDGYSNGTFRPNAGASRVEFSLMLARALYSEYRIAEVTPPPAPAPTPDKEVTPVRAKVVNAPSGLNVRSSPSASSSNNIVGRVQNGHIVEYSAVNGNWAAFTYNGKKAYVSLAYLEEVKVEPDPKPDPNPDKDVKTVRAKVVNAPNGLNVRSSPSASSSSNIIGRVQNGYVVEYYAINGNWAAFTYNGKKAYVSLSYLYEERGDVTPGIKGKVIVLDPGHGGKDPGSVANGLREKDIVLSVGLKLKNKLEQAGATVIMTRSNDVFLELSERVAIANSKRADAFISIHANAATVESANGTETYWNNTHAREQSRRLAAAIQSEMIKKLNTRDRGVKEAGFYVIKNSRMSSVLVELGFITNKEEAKKLASDSFQSDAADAIYKGVENYFK